MPASGVAALEDIVRSWYTEGYVRQGVTPPPFDWVKSSVDMTFPMLTDSRKSGLATNFQIIFGRRPANVSRDLWLLWTVIAKTHLSEWPWEFVGEASTATADTPCRMVADGPMRMSKIRMQWAPVYNSIAP